MSMDLRLMGSLLLPLILFACPGDDGVLTGTQGNSSGTTAGTPTPGTTEAPGTTNSSGAATMEGSGSSSGPGGSASSGASSSGGSSSGAGDTTAAGGSSGTTMGSSSGGESSSSSGGGGGVLPIGDPCNNDAECMTGVCWDFSDYDPLCFGTACSVNCVSDDQCVAAMTMAGAPSPMASTCGLDGRCITLGTGFGAYACAAPGR